MILEVNEGFLDNQGENGESKEKVGFVDKWGYFRICVDDQGYVMYVIY